MPEWANYDSKLSAKCHICCTSKHKMRIQYGKCTNEDCLCTGRCRKGFKTHRCLRHSDKNLQKHQLFAHGVHNSRVFTRTNRGITPVAKDLIETIIQDYDNKPLRIHMRMQKDL